MKEILPEMIILAECYIQIWKLNRKLTRNERESETQVDNETVVQKGFEGQSEALRRDPIKNAPKPSVISSNFMDTS